MWAWLRNGFCLRSRYKRRWIELVESYLLIFFIELTTAICFMSVLLARAEIFTIYCRPLEVCNRYYEGCGLYNS